MLFLIAFITCCCLIDLSKSLVECLLLAYFNEFSQSNNHVHFLNINVPAVPIDEVRGIKITRQASTNVSKYFTKRTDPKNRNYYWYSRIDNTNDEPDTDVSTLSRNYISMTPIQCDITDYKTLSELKNLYFNKK